MAPAQCRYAIYYAPDRRRLLGRFGRRWLGYDAEDGTAVARPVIAGFSAQRLAKITAQPSRYGFHATLKPPFVLRPDRNQRELADAVASFTARQHEILTPPLRVAVIGGFLALVLSAPCSALDRLAADCVLTFDAFRTPPCDSELAKRRHTGLTAAQEVLLERWGYPYVFEEFRFHMTLTERLEIIEGKRLENVLSAMVAPLCRKPLRIDAIGLFHQPAPHEKFRLLRRYRLAAAGSGSGA